MVTIAPLALINRIEGATRRRPNMAIYYRYCNAEWDGIMEGDGSLVLDDEEEDQGTKVASSAIHERERERFEAL